MTKAAEHLAESRRAHKAARGHYEKKRFPEARAEFRAALDARLAARKADPKRADPSWLEDLRNLHAGVRWNQEADGALVAKFDADIERYLRQQCGEAVNPQSQVDLKTVKALKAAVMVPDAWAMVQLGQTPGCQHVWNRVDDRRTCVACQQQEELRPKMKLEDTAAYQQLQREKTARKH